MKGKATTLFAISAGFIVAPLLRSARPNAPAQPQSPQKSAGRSRAAVLFRPPPSQRRPAQYGGTPPGPYNGLRRVSPTGMPRASASSAGCVSRPGGTASWERTRAWNLRVLPLRQGRRDSNTGTEKRNRSVPP